MAFKLYNKTLLSTPDEERHLYWADFEYHHFSEGRRKYMFLGVLNGRGPKKGQLCVIKTFKDRQGDYEDWLDEIEKATEANKLAVQFSVYVPDGKPISFAVPVIAEIDTVSHCTRLLQRLTRRKMFTPEECVSIESYLRGPFQKFNLNCGADTLRSSSYVQAFSHFTYWYTGGRRLVCDLQGIFEGESFRLTDPAIHSLDQSFGPTDEGVEGMRAFLSKHRCNRICANWFLS